MAAITDSPAIKPMSLSYPTGFEGKLSSRPETPILFKGITNEPVNYWGSRTKIKITSSEYNAIRADQGMPFSELVDKHGLEKVLTVLSLDTLRQKFEAEFGDVPDADVLKGLDLVKFSSLHDCQIISDEIMDKIKDAFKFSDLFPQYSPQTLMSIFSGDELRKKFEAEFGLNSPEAEMLDFWTLNNAIPDAKWEPLNIEALQETIMADIDSMRKMVEKHDRLIENNYLPSESDLVQMRKLDALIREVKAMPSPFSEMKVDSAAPKKSLNAFEKKIDSILEEIASKREEIASIRKSIKSMLLPSSVVKMESTAPQEAVAAVQETVEKAQPSAPMDAIQKRFEGMPPLSNLEMDQIQKEFEAIPPLWDLEKDAIQKRFEAMPPLSNLEMDRIQKEFEAFKEEIESIKKKIEATHLPSFKMEPPASLEAVAAVQQTVGTAPASAPMEIVVAPESAAAEPKLG